MLPILILNVKHVIIAIFLWNINFNFYISNLLFLEKLRFYWFLPDALASALCDFLFIVYSQLYIEI